MAITILPSNSFVVRASSSVSSDNTHRKISAGNTTTASGGGGGGKWWAPIFGWSTNADYIDSSTSSSKIESSSTRSESEAAKSKFSGCFTEEKARQLRMMTKETASFHDKMYHSAIASRLATDFSRHTSDESDHF